MKRALKRRLTSAAQILTLFFLTTSFQAGCTAYPPQGGVCASSQMSDTDMYQQEDTAQPSQMASSSSTPANQAVSSAGPAVGAETTDGNINAYTRPHSPYPPVEQEDVFYPMDEASLFNAQVHDIAIQLMDNLQGLGEEEGVIGVATFVDLNNLYRTSPLGRYLSEQLMGELQRAGFPVVEIRKTDSMLIKEHYGEYGLSREIEEIAKQTSARLILLGTYLVRGDYVFINARLVSSEDSMVASSAMKIMRKDRFMKKMLWPSAAPHNRGKAVKIPVKAFGEPTEVRIIQGS